MDNNPKNNEAFLTTRLSLAALVVLATISTPASAALLELKNNTFNITNTNFNSLYISDATVSSPGLTLDGVSSRNNQGTIEMRGVSQLDINGPLNVSGFIANHTGATPRFHAISMNGSSIININGSLNAVATAPSDSVNNRGVLMQGNSSLNVKGDFVSTINQGIGSAVDVFGTASLIVDGNTQLKTSGKAKGLNVYGTAHFKGDVSISDDGSSMLGASFGDWYSLGSTSATAVTIDGNLDISTNGHTALAISGGRNKIGGNLTVATGVKNNEFGAKTGIQLIKGELNVLGATSVSTTADAQENSNFMKQSTPYALHIISEHKKAQQATPISENLVAPVFSDEGVALGLGEEATQVANAATIAIGRNSTVKTSGRDAHSIYAGGPVADRDTIRTIKINNKGTISALQANAIDLHEFGKGKFDYQTEITNTGDVSGKYVILGSDGRDVFNSTGGHISGNIDLSEGDDRISIKNTQVSNLAILDGGKGRDELDFDFNLTGSSDSVGAVDNTKIAGWEVINVIDSGRFNLTGDLRPSTADKGNLTIYSQAALAFNAGTKEAALDYNVQNYGNIDLTQGSTAADSKLTINGNYQGNNGSTLTVKSTWNNPDVQTNDQLVIQGTASGQTAVKVRNGTIDGDVIRDNIEKNGGWSNPVVVVEGGDGGNTVFTGTANTSSASQAQLARQEENGVAKYTWTLKAGEEYIYAKPVTGYVLQPYINSQMGLSQLGQLHQRVGEQYKNGLENKQVWGRLHLDNEDLQGVNRFGAKVRSGFAQFGKDVSFKLNEDQSHRHIGLTATYGWGNSSFYDKYNAKNGEISADKFTGKSKTDMFSVGGYHTDYAADGWYVDKVAQVSWLRNHYKSEQDARQTGWGFGASVETGKAYPLKRNPNWAIEPQAQLSYQWVKLGNANDGMRRIESGSQHNLTARLGTRLTWNKSEKDNQAQAYLGANLIQTLMGRNSEVKIGQDRVEENMGGLLLALDLGGQYPLTKNLSVYGDVRYQISLDNHDSKLYRNSTLAREGYNGRVGLRYTW